VFLVEGDFLPDLTNFMKNMIPTPTGALNIAALRWNSFQQAAGANYAAISATLTPSAVQVINNAGTGYYPSMVYRFYVAGTLPGWIQPGVGVIIAASVTVSGNSIKLSDDYVVKAVDPSGTYFDVNAPRPNGSRDAAAFTATLAKTNLDTGSGGTVTPLVTLVAQCQKAMFKAASGTVIIAPTVAVGAAGDYEITLTGTSEYEVTAQPGSKFDLSDWSVKQSGAGTLAVRFL
jgi:hypothetical protein